jgi:hypothetical protein
VPEIVAEPLPLLTKLSPAGRAPLSVRLIGLVPVVVTLKLELLPSAKLVVDGLENTGLATV